MLISYLLPHKNITISNVMLFNDLYTLCEAIVKYDIQGPECVKQGINPICAKLHIYHKLLTGFHFLKGASIISLNFSTYSR